MAAPKSSALVDRFPKMIDEARGATCADGKIPTGGGGKIVSFAQKLAELWATDGSEGTLHIDDEIHSTRDQAEDVKANDSPEKRARALGAPVPTTTEFTIGSENAPLVKVRVEEEASDKEREEDQVWGFGWLHRDPPAKRLFVGFANNRNVGDFITRLERRAEEERPKKGTTAVVLLPADSATKEDVWLVLFQDGTAPQSLRPWSVR